MPRSAGRDRCPGGPESLAPDRGRRGPGSMMTPGAARGPVAPDPDPSSSNPEHRDAHPTRRAGDVPQHPLAGGLPPGRSPPSLVVPPHQAAPGEGAGPGPAHAPDPPLSAPDRLRGPDAGRARDPVDAPALPGLPVPLRRRLPARRGPAGGPSGEPPRGGGSSGLGAGPAPDPSGALLGPADRPRAAPRLGGDDPDPGRSPAGAHRPGHPARRPGPLRGPRPIPREGGDGRPPGLAGRGRPGPAGGRVRPAPASPDGGAGVPRDIRLAGEASPGRIVLFRGVYHAPLPRRGSSRLRPGAADPDPSRLRSPAGLRYPRQQARAGLPDRAGAGPARRADPAPSGGPLAPLRAGHGRQRPGLAGPRPGRRGQRPLGPPGRFPPP